MPETRCQFSDLPAWMCGCTHCRPDAAVLTSDVEIEHRMIAKHNGRCAWCHGDVLQGEVIGRTTDGDYVCERCLP